MGIFAMSPREFFENHRAVEHVLIPYAYVCIDITFPCVKRTVRNITCLNRNLPTAV